MSRLERRAFTADHLDAAGDHLDAAGSLLAARHRAHRIAEPSLCFEVGPPFRNASAYSWPIESTLSGLTVTITRRSPGCRYGYVA